MLGQTDNSRVSLMSTGGDVTLVNQSLYLSQDVTTANNWFAATTVKVQFANQYAGNLYPAMTSVTALNGSIANLGQLTTLPAAGGELRDAGRQEYRRGQHPDVACDAADAGRRPSARSAAAAAHCSIRIFNRPASPGFSICCATRSIRRRITERASRISTGSPIPMC